MSAASRDIAAAVGQDAGQLESDLVAAVRYHRNEGLASVQDAADSSGGPSPSRRALLKAGLGVAGLAAVSGGSRLLLRSNRWEDNDSYWVRHAAERTDRPAEPGTCTRFSRGSCVACTPSSAAGAARPRSPGVSSPWRESRCTSGSGASAICARPGPTAPPTSEPPRTPGPRTGRGRCRGHLPRSSGPHECQVNNSSDDHA